MTIKIVDNTFISACLGEIKCIDLLKLSSHYYNFSTTIEVHSETTEGFDSSIICDAYEKIDINHLDHSKYLDLKNWLESRYVEINTGEISTFLFALLNYAVVGENYYYITDDQKMKEVIKRLNDDEVFMDKLGKYFDMTNFHVTGTIGFLRRLIDKKILSEDYIEPLIKDMEDNGFYITESIKDYLRGCG